MVKSYVNQNADCILLDPFLLNDFNTIKHGIPFYKTDNEILILLKNEITLKLGGYKVKTFFIQEDDFNEKVFLIKFK